MIHIKKTKESVIIYNNNLRYEVYFDKDHHSIFVGQPQGGAMIDIKLEEGGVTLPSLKMKYKPIF
jgi:hypothetical protein